MSDIIDLKKKWNHRWKTDPVFIEGFDYEKPEYADTPDGLRWALPIHECISRPEEVQRQKRVQEEAKKELEAERRANRLKSRKLSTIG
jgi:hypothetical protein